MVWSDRSYLKHPCLPHPSTPRWETRVCYATCEGTTCKKRPSRLERPRLATHSGRAFASLGRGGRRLVCWPRQGTSDWRHCCRVSLWTRRGCALCTLIDSPRLTFGAVSCSTIVRSILIASGFKFSVPPFFILLTGRCICWVSISRSHRIPMRCPRQRSQTGGHSPNSIEWHATSTGTAAPTRWRSLQAAPSKASRSDA